MTGLLTLATAVGVGATGLSIGLAWTAAEPPAAAFAAGPRPLFQLPFPCGESWHLATYPGHDDYDIDMTPNSGSAWGRPILASFGGQVIASGISGTLGNRTPSNPGGPIGTGGGYFVKLDHGGGWQTLYLHMLEPPMVSTGQSVVIGQQIGKVGSTGQSFGPHLHYEQRADGAKIESWFNGVPSGITTDGDPPGEPQSGPVDLISNNCGQAIGMSHLTGGEYNRDGYTDLLAIEAATGKLWLYPGLSGSAGFGARAQVGTSWGAMIQVTGGEFNRDAYTDVLAVDGSGVLWLYPGINGAGFGARVQVGSSWGAMTNLTGGEFSRDAYTDLLAVDGSGALWLYPGLASGAGFGARVLVGTSWGGMRELTGGEYSRDGYTDLLTVEAATGKLWLYPGLASGAGFGSRVQIGTNWNTLNDLTGGELNRDPYTDLLAVEPSTGKLWLYPGVNGVGFGARIQVGSGGW